MRVFIGMETSGVSRRAFERLGHTVLSCDLLPAQDGRELSLNPENGMLVGHWKGDVFRCLERLRERGEWPDLAIFHPTCTYLTLSAAYAFKDPDFVKYPGVGYHQKLKPGTLFGAARRAARREAVAFVKRIWDLPIEKKAIENPIGFLSSMFMKPSQIVQPYDFGDDASKSTCFWIEGLPLLKSTGRFPPRIIEYPEGSGRMVERWSNQSPCGAQKMGPSDDRWQLRSDTFDGIATAFAEQWGGQAERQRIAA